MSARGEAIAARARKLVGTRFRPQGRDPVFGLDCVGTAAAAVGVPGEAVPRDYQLRGELLAEMEEGLCDFGCRPVVGPKLRVGDLVVCRAGPAQYHLVVMTGGGFVHADARLRLVVERPLPLPWPRVSAWRMVSGDYREEDD
jgi:cell wall-associated NlpC family hydrolase